MMVHILHVFHIDLLLPLELQRIFIYVTGCDLHGSNSMNIACKTHIDYKFS